MAEADPAPLRVGPATGLMPAKRARRVPRSWIWGFVVFVVTLALLVGYGLSQVDAARWTPGAKGPVFAKLRVPIRPGVQGPGPHVLDYARIDARLGQLAQDPDIVGMAVVIVEDGRLMFIKGYGVTAADGKEPVTPNTVFRWASLSKGVAATLVTELADQKRLSLSDPIARHAPSLRLPGGAEQVVTVADVLSHRLGLVHNAYDDKLEEGIDPRMIRRMLGQLDRYCPPGTCHGYQNVAYDAASEVVEKVTGRPYAEMVAERIFAPVGMASASVTRAGLEGSPSWARPHTGRRVLPVQDAYYRVPAAGGINSSVFDLGLWMRAQMGVGGAIPPHVLAELHQPLVPTERRRGALNRAMTDATYGLGWRESRYLGHPLVGHRGAVKGYRSLIMFDPAAKTGVAILWNSESNKPAGLQMEVLDMLYKQPLKDWLELGDKPVARARG